MNILTHIREIIQKALPDAEVHVLDPRNDGQHLEAIVISPSFEGKMLFAQHQMVMKALKAAFAQSLHALELKTFTPGKWADVKEQFKEDLK